MPCRIMYTQSQTCSTDQMLTWLLCAYYLLEHVAYLVFSMLYEVQSVDNIQLYVQFPLPYVYSGIG